MSSRLLPHTFDALLPTPERYSSLRFRRVSRFLQLRLLDWADAVELCAFVETVGVEYATYIFHWNGQAVVRAYRRLRRHVGDHPDLAKAIAENETAMGVDAGLAVLQAMRDGGWESGSLPACVRAALKDLRKAGLNMAQIAERTGLRYDQVRHVAGYRSGRGKAVQAGAFGALAV